VAVDVIWYCPVFVSNESSAAKPGIVIRRPLSANGNDDTREVSSFGLQFTIGYITITRLFSGFTELNALPLDEEAG
jgi:hypothetical protein